jgi:hypothetical protein
MAVIVVVALFAIMLLFLGSSLRSLNYLRQDLKLIERQQLQRLHRTNAVTNVAALSNSLTSIESTWTLSPPSASR